MKITPKEAISRLQIVMQELTRDETDTYKSLSIYDIIDLLVEVKGFITQEENKDELLGLYREYFDIINNQDGYEWHYRLEPNTQLPKEIKALETKLKDGKEEELKGDD